jgi:hypothetical protein
MVKEIRIGQTISIQSSEKWMNLYQQLPFLRSICVPRLVKVKNKITNIQVTDFLMLHKLHMGHAYFYDQPMNKVKQLAAFYVRNQE